MKDIIYYGYGEAVDTTLALVILFLLGLGLGICVECIILYFIL